MPSFTARGSGGTEIRINNVRANRMEVSGSGGTEFSLAGVAKEFDVDLSGGVELDAENLAAESVAIEASGGVSATLRASAEINGSASGGVDLHVKGNPARSLVATSGGADVHYQ